MKRITFVLLAALAVPALAGSIYKCPQPDGTTMIQQMPCSPTGGGEKIQVNAQNPSGDGGLREGEKDMLSKSSPGLMLKALEKDLVRAQGDANAAKEKANRAQRDAEVARRNEQTKQP